MQQKTPESKNFDSEEREYKDSSLPDFSKYEELNTYIEKVCLILTLLQSFYQTVNNSRAYPTSKSIHHIYEAPHHESHHDPHHDPYHDPQHLPINMSPAEPNYKHHSEVYLKKRTKIPIRANVKFNIWEILRDAVGKDLSKFSMPGKI